MTLPDDLSEMPPVVMKPSAIGNPDEPLRVFAPSLLAFACKGSAPSRDGGVCLGLNGFHAPDCEEQRP